VVKSVVHEAREAPDRPLHGAMSARKVGRKKVPNCSSRALTHPDLLLIHEGSFRCGRACRRRDPRFCYPA